VHEHTVIVLRPSPVDHAPAARQVLDADPGNRAARSRRGADADPAAHADRDVVEVLVLPAGDVPEHRHASRWGPGAASFGGLPRLAGARVASGEPEARAHELLAHARIARSSPD